MGDELLDIKQTADFVRKCRATIYIDIRRGEFPRPISIGRRRVMWRKSELITWLESRPLGGPASEAA